MRFFIVSQNGDAAGIAWQLKQEGNEVLMFIKDPSSKRTLLNVVTHVGSIREGINEGPDVVLFDMVGQGKEADDLRENGWNVIGGGAWNDRLELDRRFSAKLMDSFSIRAPRSFAFRNMRDALEFAQDHKRLLVFKPHFNKGYTFVPKSQDELLAYMLHLRQDRKVDGAVTLQEFIKGTEISTEIWYARGRPVPMPNSTIETKMFLSGEVGPATGCQTSLVFTYPTREPRIIQQTLKKISIFLERQQYTGPLDINGIARKGRLYALEFTPRFGYSAIYALARLLREPLGDVLARVSRGETDPMKLREGFGYSLRVTIPPYPFKPDDKVLRRRVYERTANQLIGGLSKTDLTKVYPLDAYLTKHGLYTAGIDGVVCECTGHGLTPYDAEREATGLFRKLSLPNKQARLGDTTRIAERRLRELREQGYEVPPFAPPPVLMEMVIEEKEKKDEGKSIQGEQLSLAAKLNVKPGALADPRVKSN
jgi:phosphoribosylamine--glycine ligase